MTVLITRPIASGRLLAERLTALGYETMLEPLLVIEPVTNPLPDFSRFTALLFTSANGIAMLSDAVRSELLIIPCFCVGDSTAEAARAAGFVHVHSAQGAGEDLARLIMQHYPAAQISLLHICGMETDPSVQSALRTAGYQIANWAVYRAVPQTSFSTRLHDALLQQRINTVLLFSPRTAQTFASLSAGSGVPM
ncbi:MAG: uroporphyrinogen-III synthase, partial [Alphaproteobacteria bacterium]|nr:uroporphyrinogen-III synthase [Alphaproteobacteria bacterium]